MPKPGSAWRKRREHAQRLSVVHKGLGPAHLGGDPLVPLDEAPLRCEPGFGVDLGREGLRCDVPGEIRADIARLYRFDGSSGSLRRTSSSVP